MIALAFVLTTVAAWLWSTGWRFSALLALCAAALAAGPLAIWGVLSTTIVGAALVKLVVSRARRSDPRS